MLHGYEVENTVPDFLERAPAFSSDPASLWVKGDIPKKLLPAPPRLKLIGVKELTFLCVLSGNVKMFLTLLGYIDTSCMEVFTTLGKLGKFSLGYQPRLNHLDAPMPAMSMFTRNETMDLFGLLINLVM